MVCANPDAVVERGDTAASIAPARSPISMRRQAAACSMPASPTVRSMSRRLPPRKARADARRRTIGVLAIGDSVRTDLKGAAAIRDRLSVRDRRHPCRRAGRTRQSGRRSAGRHLRGRRPVSQGGDTTAGVVGRNARPLRRAVRSAFDLGQICNQAFGGRCLKPSRCRSPSATLTRVVPMRRSIRHSRAPSSPSAISTVCIAGIAPSSRRRDSGRRRLRRPAAALTFEPHPRSFFRPHEPLFRLTDERTKLRLFATTGLPAPSCCSSTPRWRSRPRRISSTTSCCTASASRVPPSASTSASGTTAPARRSCLRPKACGANSRSMWCRQSRSTGGASRRG